MKLFHQADFVDDVIRRHPGHRFLGPMPPDASDFPGGIPAIFSMSPDDIGQTSLDGPTDDPTSDEAVPPGPIL